MGEDEEEEDGLQRSSRQRAAKKVAKNAYTMDVVDELEYMYMDSPTSSLHSSHSRGGDTGGSMGGGSKKDRKKPGRKKKRRKGRVPVSEEEEEEEELMGKVGKTEPRVPPMKIKIGRSVESDSPIFFAESVDSWDESGTEKSSGRKKNKGKGKRAQLKVKDRELDIGSGQSSPVVLGDDEVRRVWCEEGETTRSVVWRTCLGVW